MQPVGFADLYKDLQGGRQSIFDQPVEMRDEGKESDDMKTSNIHLAINDPAPCRRLTTNGFYKNKSGFTLLELIIVLLLSLLILGLVTAYFAKLLSSVKLQATAREFSATLRQARDLAKIHGEQQGWSVNLDSKEYGIEGRPVKKIPSHLELKIVDSTGEEVRSGQYRLVFDPNWSMDSVQFQLSDKKKAIGIELDPLLGAVVIR